MRRDPKGFTLIELMIVVAIIGTLVAVAMPKLANAIRNANEGSSLGNLGIIRSAVSVYYTDTEGTFPSDLTPIFQAGSKYLSQSMSVYTRTHGVNRTVDYVPDTDDGDSGAWGYVNEGASLGRVFIHCAHTDLKGNTWNQY